MKTRAIDAKPDDYLSITQVVDENGSEQDIISTGLLIVDDKPYLENQFPARWKHNTRLHMPTNMPILSI